MRQPSSFIGRVLVAVFYTVAIALLTLLVVLLIYPIAALENYFHYRRGRRTLLRRLRDTTLAALVDNGREIADCWRRV